MKLSVDNEPRTEADASEWEPLLSASGKESGGSHSFFLCAAEEVVGGTLSLGLLTLDSSHRTLSELDVLGGAYECTVEAPNPAIVFASTTLRGTHVLSDASFIEHAIAPDVVLLVALLPRPPPCNASFVIRGSNSTNSMNDGGAYYRLDERLKMTENTLSRPAVNATEIGYGCPNVAKTFLNAATCVQTEPCAPLTYTSVKFALNETTLREWYQRSNRYVYYVDGLRLEDNYAISPCNVSYTSRWAQLAGACKSETALDAETIKTLAEAIRSSADQSNPHVRDVNVSDTDSTCHMELHGISTIGASISVNGTCWTHVHPSHYDVRDFTYWVNQHLGGAVAFRNGRRNPISAFAEKGGVKLTFPWHHRMSTQWKTNVQYYSLLGRLGDVQHAHGELYALQTRVFFLHMALGCTVWRRRLPTLPPSRRAYSPSRWQSTWELTVQA
mgnify:CR=1 FL=1